MFQAPGRAHRAHHRHHPALPGGMEYRLVRLGLDLAETVHAAHVVNAVHGRVPALRQSGADHAIARDELGELLLAPALRAGGPHRQHEEARLGGGIPDADFGLLGSVRPKSASTPRGPSRRASDRARPCTRPAAGPAFHG